MSTFSPGSRIGGLIIGELLGRGAMGEVYRAEQVSLKRPVAVKRIASHLADNDEVLQRFEREAQCIARVQHPNVLSVYEFGRYTDDTGGDHVLMVMELVEGGRSLKQLLATSMDPRVVGSVVMQVADGLAAAAEDGIVHRDIKPDNIMISAKGVAKLADFGLAKASDSVGMTMSGSILGTPYYMSPEACMGESVGPAGDLYSLGATWYHCLAGKPPFEASNTMMILRAHVEEEPSPLRSLAPAVPPEVASLVHACLAKDPAKRPASAAALSRQLHEMGLPRTVPNIFGVLPPSDAATLPVGGTTRPTEPMQPRRDLDLSLDPTRATFAPVRLATGSRRRPGLLVGAMALGLLLLGVGAYAISRWLGGRDGSMGSGNGGRSALLTSANGQETISDGGLTAIGDTAVHIKPPTDVPPPGDPPPGDPPSSAGTIDWNTQHDAIADLLTRGQLDDADRLYAGLTARGDPPEAARERHAKLQDLLKRLGDVRYKQDLEEVLKLAQANRFPAARTLLEGMAMTARLAGYTQNQQRLLTIIDKLEQLGDTP